MAARPYQIALTLEAWQYERLQQLPDGERSKLIRRALTEFFSREDQRRETEMTTVKCQAGESVFEAAERGISEGKFPAGSRVITTGASLTNPTCENQVGAVEVRRGERYAVQGPRDAQ